MRLSVRNVRDILLGEKEDLLLPEYRRMVQEERSVFVDVLRTFVHHKVAMASPIICRILAASWMTNDNEVSSLLLEADGVIGFTEIHRAAMILDAPRKSRCLERRLERIGKVKRRRQIETEIHNLRRESHSGSFTGSMEKKVRKWVRNLSETELTFFLLNFPLKPWRELADICHFNPSDFALECFLHVVYGKSPPPNNIIEVGRELTATNAEKLILKNPSLCHYYSFIRRKIDVPLQLGVRGKEQIAKVAPLMDVIWYYEELECRSVENAVKRRLDEGETLSGIRSGYAKLMERLLMMKNRKVSFIDRLLSMAEEQLSRLCICRNDNQDIPRVVVIGDASASMGIAIQVSTILSSLISVSLQSELIFFNYEVFSPSKNPTSAKDTLHLASELKRRARGRTCPAAALWPYYEKRELVSLFVVVTDEQENMDYNGESFASLFKKYKTEVNPEARVFFVSFHSSATRVGRMSAELTANRLTYQKFLLDIRRPDLTKFESLLGILAVEILEGYEEEQIVEEKDDGDEVEQADSLKCCVCLENSRDTVFLDCRHQCCCSSCADNLTECPVCRARIQRVIRVFR